ncbi:MAG: ATP-binding cassette domain-containing protein [Bacillota bacterium]|nr:ATP-binding cassette domain-containing protein [Bacillota bacterium]
MPGSLSALPVLELEGLSKSFGPVRAVLDVSFQVRAGTAFGVIGPNGAGKTTTLRMILNILEPDAGRVLFLGRPARELPRRSFGYLPEEHGLYPRMPVREQLAFFGRLAGLPPGEAQRRADAWIERLGLEPWANKPAQTLSKGNAQKAQLATALLHEPELIILDEPFSGLDPVNVDLLKSVIREQVAAGRTLLFSSHRMEHVEELCEGVCLIAAGRAVLAGPVRRVKEADGRRTLRLAFAEAGEDGEPVQGGRGRALYEAVARELGLSVSRRGVDYWEYLLEPGRPVEPGPLLDRIRTFGTPLRFEIGLPSLERIYIDRVESLQAEPGESPAPAPARAGVRRGKEAGA